MAIVEMVDNMDEPFHQSDKKNFINRALGDEETLAGAIHLVFISKTYFTKAWKKVGYPFAVLNGIYKMIMKKDHPRYETVFRENS